MIRFPYALFSSHPISGGIPALAACVGALLLAGCLSTELADIGTDKCPNEPGLPQFNGCPSDEDKDGMKDWWESQKGLDISLNDAANDGDADGLTNLQEHAKDTNPNLADTDLDGVNDSLDACPILAGTGANGCAP